MAYCPSYLFIYLKIWKFQVKGFSIQVFFLRDEKEDEFLIQWMTYTGNMPKLTLQSSFLHLGAPSYEIGQSQLEITFQFL